MPEVPIDIAKFDDWCQEFPGMYVLNVRGSSSMIHLAGCGHYTYEEPVAYAEKWVSADLLDLERRAAQLGVPSPLCSDCLRISRRKFIESLGATCANWTWSWSFVNHDRRLVIFGAWDAYSTPEGDLIMSENWRFNERLQKQNSGYSQSREHLRLIEEEGYSLATFPMEMKNAKKHVENDGEPAKIGKFVPEIAERKLEKRGADWFAM